MFDNADEPLPHRTTSSMVQINSISHFLPLSFLSCVSNPDLAISLFRLCCRIGDAYGVLGLDVVLS